MNNPHTKQLLCYLASSFYGLEWYTSYDRRATATKLQVTVSKDAPCAWSSTSGAYANLSQSGENQTWKFQFCSLSFFLVSFSDMHNSKTKQRVWILYITNNSPATRHLPLKVWVSVWAMTGELWPQNWTPVCIAIGSDLDCMRIAWNHAVSIQFDRVLTIISQSESR